MIDKTIVRLLTVSFIFIFNAWLTHTIYRSNKNLQETNEVIELLFTKDTSVDQTIKRLENQVEVLNKEIVNLKLQMEVNTAVLKPEENFTLFSTNQYNYGIRLAYANVEGKWGALSQCSGDMGITNTRCNRVGYASTEIDFNASTDQIQSDLEQKKFVPVAKNHEIDYLTETPGESGGIPIRLDTVSNVNNELVTIHQFYVHISQKYNYNQDDEIQEQIYLFKVDEYTDSQYNVSYRQIL